MKKILIRIIVLLLVFIGGIAAASLIINKGNTEVTEEMSYAVLPVVYLECGTTSVNELHGYKQEMEITTMRSSITPLPADRKLPVRIETYGMEIASVSYEIRSMDSSRLLENPKVEKYEEKDGSISAKLNIKNLMEPETEYILSILLETESKELLHYYTRIIYSEQFDAQQYVNFALDFSAKTFDKLQGESLALYLESNEEGDNTTYQRVDIHSSYDQITWGDLNPSMLTTPNPQIVEINSTSATLLLNYMVQREDAEEIYRIEEYFRLRHTNDRMYLLGFERTMNQVFLPENEVVTENGITLGITDASFVSKVNEREDAVAFVQNGELWCYDRNGGRLSLVFGFREEDLTDVRTSYPHHGIKIIRIAESGTMDFAVYGYMNRGRHEGKGGIALYHYDSGRNTVEEKLFVESAKSYSYLKQEAETVLYYSDNNYLYVASEDNIYEINVDTEQVTTLMEGTKEHLFVSSEDNRLAAWQTEEGGAVIWDFDRMSSSEVQPKAEGEIIVPLGFVEGDFVFGNKRASDQKIGRLGDFAAPMYSLQIRNQSGEIVKEYEQADYFISGVRIEKGVIAIDRLKLGENGYEDTGEDHIVNNDIETEDKILTDIFTTEEKKKEVRIAFTDPLSDTAPQYLTPKEVIQDKRKIVVLKRAKEEQNKQEQYYVFAKGQFIQKFSEPGQAVDLADNLSGVVTDETMHAIWEKGNRKVRTELGDLDDELWKSDADDIAIGIAAMLPVKRDPNTIAEKLASGKSPADVLKEEAKGRVLNLSSCRSDVVLNFVSRGYPVLAMKDNTNAVLIIGYDELNVLIFDPETGIKDKIGRNDAAELFEAAGNSFLSFMPKLDPVTEE